MSRGKCRYQVPYGALRIKPCGKPSKPGHPRGKPSKPGHPRGYCKEHADQTAREGRKR